MAYQNVNHITFVGGTGIFLGEYTMNFFNGLSTTHSTGMIVFVLKRTII